MGWVGVKLTTWTLGAKPPTVKGPAFPVEAHTVYFWLEQPYEGNRGANHSSTGLSFAFLATFQPYSVYADMSPQMILALICLLEQVRILTILRAKASHHGHKEFQYLLRA